MRTTVDLNCDLGEGFPFDAELMTLITSANVACGAHAGDEATMRATLQLAKENGVQVGAHPGYPDREHFGRHELNCSASEVAAFCERQVKRLEVVASEVGWTVSYLKPHGALYNQACKDHLLAQPIVDVARAHRLAIMGLPQSELERCTDLPDARLDRLGTHKPRVQFVAEGFADRRYRPDGSLVPRSEPDAFIDNVADAVAQAEWLLREVGVQTICVHGDNPQAVGFVRALREGLQAQGWTIKAFGC